MKKLIIALFVGSLSTAAFAEKPKSEDVTATGNVVCAHCDLEVVTKCQKAIKLDDGKAILLTGKKVKAFFKAPATKKVKRVTVTGKPAGKEGKHVILAASKIEEAKAEPKEKKKTS